MKDPVEENLFVYFRKALPEDVNIKWIPAGYTCQDSYIWQDTGESPEYAGVGTGIGEV